MTTENKKAYRIEYKKEGLLPWIVEAHLLKYVDGIILFVDNGPPSRIVMIVNADIILQVTETVKI